MRVKNNLLIMEQEADVSIDQICWLFCVDYSEKIFVKKFPPVR